MIKTKKQITEYIKKFCKTYSLDYTWFFYQYDDNDFNRKSAPIFSESSIESKIPLLSELFGLTYEEITTCDMAGLDKWNNKYTFFKLLKSFNYAQVESYYGENFKEELILNSIFSHRNGWKFTQRYDIKDVESRAVEKLKMINKVMPGTYHSGVELENFRFETEHLCSFPQIGDMIRSQLEMLDTVKTLFFKAVNADLSKEEELEYNFLVTVLGVKDVASRHYLYYKNVILLRKIIKEEGYTDFYSYARLDGLKDLSPWRAKEFVDDSRLVQDYINEYPFCYRNFSSFAKEVGRFCCSFIWADEPFVKDEGLSEVLDDEIQMTQKWTHIYVEKTTKEMRGDEAYVNKYIRLSGSPKQGGVLLPKRELPLFHYIKVQDSRMMKYVTALRGKNND